jgi:hypothetical protein
MTFNASDVTYKVNVSFPNLSVQVQVNKTAGRRPGLFTQHLLLRYFW